MKAAPLALTTSQFETKEKLVEAVKKLATEELWLDRVNDQKGLERVSNRKLLRLHGALQDAKQRFGSRDKLITAILETEHRVEDAGLRSRLERYPLPRLLDLHDAARKRAAKHASQAESGQPPAQPKKKTSRSKKAQKKLRGERNA